jgi:Rieske Fe-S protein
MLPTNDTRRGFLKLLTAALMAVLALCLLVPAIAYVCSPIWRRRDPEGADDTFSDVCALADLPAGKWQLLTLEVVRRNGWAQTKSRRSIWVRRPADGSQSVAVLSPICPHLGCPIDWRPERSEFVCPCHKGTFDVEGRVTAGPPPRRMDTLETEVRDGRLRVRWQDFKIGVAERTPVGV